LNKQTREELLDEMTTPGGIDLDSAEALWVTATPFEAHEGFNFKKFAKRFDVEA
jgi:hypothetical protein